MTFSSHLTQNYLFFRAGPFSHVGLLYQSTTNKFLFFPAFLYFTYFSFSGPLPQNRAPGQRTPWLFPLIGPGLWQSTCGPMWILFF